MPPPDRATEARLAQRFWMGQLHAALAGYGVAAVALTGYIALTWPQPNRGWMIATIGVALTLVFGIYCLRHSFVRSRHRAWLFGSWNIITFGFGLWLCMLDGGIDSPMAYLYIVPMMYLGIGFPLRVVLVNGLVGLAGCVWLIELNPGSVNGPAHLLLLTALGIGWLLAAIGSINRNRQDRALHELRQRLETLAATDELTGCLNQRAFRLALEQEIARARRYNHALALLVIDIDHFKQINDRHGHLMGDTVLQQVGAMLRQTARQADRVGRPGGDELALIASETSRADACLLAERIRAQIKALPLPIAITLSIGICAARPDTDGVTTLFRRADQALYRAKRHGRDQVAVWHSADAIPSE